MTDEQKREYLSKCESICTGYKWLCDNCIKNATNHGND